MWKSFWYHIRAVCCVPVWCFAAPISVAAVIVRSQLEANQVQYPGFYDVVDYPLVIAILALMVIDLVSKWIAITKKFEGSLKPRFFFKAFKDGYINSEAFRKGFSKIVSYAVLMAVAIFIQWLSWYLVNDREASAATKSVLYGFSTFIYVSIILVS